METKIKIYKYNHNNGEIIISDEIKEGLINDIKNLLISSYKCPDLKKNLLKILTINGWSNPIRAVTSLNITITSAKKKTGLCIQLGNMARFYADLLKLQKMFDNGKITSAIYIIMTKRLAKKFGSNIANYERFTQELIYFKDIINVPVLVLGIGED